MTPELNREYPELDDAEVFEQMVRLTVEQMKPVCGHLRRGQHAKATGCVTAEFRIADDVPSDLRHGIFSQPGRAFSAIVRFSNSQGTFEKDGTGTARGLAIRLLDVAGTRAVPDDGGNTQDFLMVDNPRFPFRDPKAYLEIIKRKVMGADLSPKIGELSALAHMALFEHDELKILKEIKGKHVASPLEIKYWSGTPFWLGPANGDGGHAVKYSAYSRLAGRTLHRIIPMIYRTTISPGHWSAVCNRRKHSSISGCNCRPTRKRCQWKMHRSNGMRMCPSQSPSRRFGSRRSRWILRVTSRPSAKPCLSTRGTRSQRIAPWVE